jgi:hypothetical protein
VHDEAPAGVAVADGDELAGAGDIDEPQPGKVQVDLTGASDRQRGERGMQAVPGGPVRIAGEHQPAVAMERADGERVRGGRRKWLMTVAHGHYLFKWSSHLLQVLRFCIA